MNNDHRRWWARIDVKETFPGKGTKRIFRNDPCAFCGGPGGTLDHILPRGVTRTGKHERGDYMNYTGACERCNCVKGSGHFLYFFAIVARKPIIGYDHDPRGFTTR